MLKELVLVALCAVVFFIGEAESSYKIMKNPKGYGSYKCPKGYKLFHLDYKNRKHWTFMVFATKDAPMCALKGVPKSKCRSNKGKKKFWATFSYGFAEFHITKWDRFSNMLSGSGDDTSSDPSKDSSKDSYSLIPQYFAIRAFYFKIRGAYKVTIMFEGDISKTVVIKGNAIDWRKKTWICIMWETFPIFSGIWMTFEFDRRRKAKLWDLCAYACCEKMTDGVVVGKKK